MTAITMPRELKLAILSLTLSGVACLAAMAIDGWALRQFLSGPSFFQLLSSIWLGLNALWLLLLIWLGWALIKRQQVSQLLLVASVVLVANLLWNWAADDTALTLLLQAIELLAMVAACYWARAAAAGQAVTAGER